jgi:PAS domain S-box-containing protein
MRDRIRLAGILTGITVLYVASGLLGLTLTSVDGSATAVWPPAGIAVAALLVVGLRAWPAAALGAFLTNVATSHAILPSIAIAAGNTLEYVVAALLAIRFAHGRFAFDRGPDILRFTALSALLAPVIAATAGTATLRLSGLAPPGDAGLVWLTWWLGDAVGIALFTPMCVLLTVRQSPARAGRGEALGLGVCVALMLAVAFSASESAARELPLAMLMLPLLLWSAFRFTARTTSVMGVLLSAFAVYRILNQLGPFAQGEPTTVLLSAQAFVAVMSVLMLSVAAEVHIRGRVEAEIRLLNDTLERRVDERTTELTRVHHRLVEAQSVAHVGSWEWDVSSNAIWWSDEMCRVFGLSTPPANYEGYLALVHPDDRDRTHAAVGATLETGRPFSFDHRIVRPDGECRVLHANGSVERDGAGRPIRLVGIGHDITERSVAEEARTQLIHEQVKLREAEEANRAKDAFLATLSHELRTPLNAALGWAHILRDSLREGDRDVRAVQAIYRNLLIQSRLVSDILDVSRIARGEVRLERELVEMTSVFEAARDMVRETAAARGVTIDIATAGIDTVTGDNRRLEQVAWNLLSNAVKYAADGGRVTISILERDGAVECSVADDGPGIAREFLPHVFERFSQADASVTRKHGGLGLGLAIAHDIIELHQGTITAGTNPGGGAVFMVRLLRHDAAAAVSSPATRDPVRPGDAGRA